MASTRGSVFPADPQAADPSVLRAVSDRPSQAHPHLKQLQCGCLPVRTCLRSPACRLPVRWAAHPTWRTTTLAFKRTHFMDGYHDSSLIKVPALTSRHLATVLNCERLSQTWQGSLELWPCLSSPGSPSARPSLRRCPPGRETPRTSGRDIRPLPAGPSCPARPTWRTSAPGPCPHSPRQAEAPPEESEGEAEESKGLEGTNRNAGFLGGEEEGFNAIFGNCRLGPRKARPAGCLHGPP